LSTEIARFVDDLHASYLQAEQASGDGIDRFLRIRDQVVHLRFAGPALCERLYGALAHLACEPTPRPELTVCLFDSGSTATPPPPAPWTARDVREGGLVKPLCDERFTTVYQVAAGLLTVIDRNRDLAICWVRQADDLPMAERAAPIRRLFQHWLADRGLLLVHGGAVGFTGGGVLLAGEGGAGKSTSALACLQSRLGYAGDDYCLVDTGVAPHVHSLYNTGKTDESGLERLSFLAPMVSNRESLATEKALFFLHHHVPDKLIAVFPLEAIVVPRVAGLRKTRLGPISRGGALRALAPTTVLLSPSTASRVLPALAALVRRVPVYEMALGPDPAQVPVTIAGLLAARQSVVA
jgi:hypothetical protein